ncbi:MAG: hypothetical protein WBY88_01655, partial [Desulfosarcina sp.]
MSTPFCRSSRQGRKRLAVNRYRIVETAFGFAAVAFATAPFEVVEIKLPTSDLGALCLPFDEACWRID